MAICPICGEEVAPRGTNKAFPFCTSQCKAIDLGKWLNEEYRVPTVPDESGEGGDEGGGDGGDGRDGRGEEPLEDSPTKTDMRH